MIPFVEKKRVLINFKQCHSYVVDNNKIVSDVDDTLSCPEHEEADTKIVFHISNTDAQANFVIRCSDTDIAIIMLGHMHNLINDDSNVWLNAGTGNNQRYINLTKVYEHLGPSLSRSLPRFHALTGCDFNPAFFKRGKQRPLNILMKKPEYPQAFMQFGGPESFTEELIQENIFNTIQKFICEIYNVSGVLDVDAARLQLFFNNYSVNNFNEAFNRKNLKNFDASNLPPCKSELFQQFLRANYISSVWNNANVKLPTIFTPEHNGWRFEENQYHFHWFDGDQLPGDISEFIKNSDEAASNGNITDDDEDDDSSGQYRDWMNKKLTNTCCN
ncbi:uncharacterized protein LOC141532227 [Cotesia typhae]|uniref:uncharacterized protein LOC141532227 n=1 Tax=Cotesia typhae TaxID=2053667 RepID=UPI003D68D551